MSGHYSERGWVPGTPNHALRFEFNASASSAPQRPMAPVYAVRCAICGSEPPSCFHGWGRSLAQLRLVGYRHLA